MTSYLEAVLDLQPEVLDRRVSSTTGAKSH
jgi:hypothetical protein